MRGRKLLSYIASLIRLSGVKSPIIVTISYEFRCYTEKVEGCITSLDATLRKVESCITSLDATLRKVEGCITSLDATLRRLKAV